MNPLRFVAIICLALVAVCIEVVSITRLRRLELDRDEQGRPKELLRAQARLEFELNLASVSKVSAEYSQRFSYPRNMRRTLEPLVRKGVDEKIRAQRQMIAQERAANEFMFLTLSLLARRDLEEGIPGVLRKALLDHLLARKSADLEFGIAKVGGSTQDIYRNLQRQRELAGNSGALSYVRQFELANAWAVQKLREATLNCLEESKRRSHGIGAAREVDSPPPGLAEHYFAFRFQMVNAEVNQLKEMRHFVEGLRESESVFGGVLMKQGIVSREAAELAAMERDVAAQDFMLLRPRSTLFAISQERGLLPSPVLLAEFSRLRWELATARVRTDLEVEQHLQQDPNGAAARAMAIASGANPLFQMKRNLAVDQAWAELDKSFLDVMPGSRREVNFLSSGVDGDSWSLVPHALQIGHAFMEIANLKADIAQSSAIRSIEVGPSPFGLDAADRRQNSPGYSSVSDLWNRQNDLIARQAQGGVQMADFLMKLQETAPLAAKENYFSKQIGVIEFLITTRNQLPPGP